MKNHFNKTASDIFEKDFDCELHHVEKDFWKNVCDLTFLEIGGDRVVYKWEDKVVKFAADNNSIGYQKGLKQNKHEIKLYNKANPTQKEFLAEILDYSKDKKWIVTPYYENIVRDMSDEERRKLEADLLGVGIKFPDAFENNIAFFEGRYILVDYGYKTRLESL